MSEVLLFHHAQGLTPGVHAFADDLRGAGHTVHTPDVYDGHTFDDLEAGLAHARELGFQELFDRGVRAAEGLPAALVYAGFSLGVMPAQALAQTRPGARGALLLHSAVPVTEFSPAWPTGVPVQVHAMEHDPFFVEEDGTGDVEAARALVAEAAATTAQDVDAPGAELFLYPGDQHLFTDRSLAAYDADAAALVTERVLAFLQGR